MIKSYSFKKKEVSRGFTMPELLVIIFITVVLSSLVLMFFSSERARVRDVKRIAEVDIIKQAVQRYYLDYEEYPEQDDVWCSVEGSEVNPECTNLNTEIEDYLPEIPGDPLYGKGLEPTGAFYSYQYITTNDGSEYKIHADLEEGGSYEVYSMNGKAIPGP